MEKYIDCDWCGERFHGEAIQRWIRTVTVGDELADLCEGCQRTHEAGPTWNLDKPIVIMP